MLLDKFDYGRFFILLLVPVKGGFVELWSISELTQLGRMILTKFYNLSRFIIPLICDYYALDGSYKVERLLVDCKIIEKHS